MAKSKRARQPAARTQGGGTAQNKASRTTTGAKPNTTTSTANTPAARVSAAKRVGASASSGAGAQPSRLASIRERAPAPRALQQRRYAQTPWWKGTWGIVSLIGGFVLIIAIIIYVAYQQAQASAAGIGSPVPTSVMNEVTHVNSSVFSTVGAGPNANPLAGLPLSTAPLTVNGHPEILYIGGDYCPFCAALRWSLVIALSRFGAFKNLRLMKSSHTDLYPDTNTFTFSQSSYTSASIVFVPREIYDRNQAPMQTLTTQEQQLFTAYDKAPYTSGSPGSIPFVYFGGHYILIGAPFVPTNLQGLSWQTIAAGLGDPTNPATQDIIGAANQITAAICLMDNQQPGSVCQTPTIQSLEKKAPTRK